MQFAPVDEVEEANAANRRGCPSRELCPAFLEAGAALAGQVDDIGARLRNLVLVPRRRCDVAGDVGELDDHVVGGLAVLVADREMHVLVVLDLRLDQRHVREHVLGALDAGQASRVFADRAVFSGDQTDSQVWLKAVTSRPRPFVSIHHVHVLINRPASGSMPSAHATTAFAGALLLSWLWPNWRIGFLALATVIAFSRVYVAVHYPADVLAGAALGSAVAFVGIALAGRTRVRGGF